MDEGRQAERIPLQPQHLKRTNGINTTSNNSTSITSSGNNSSNNNSCSTCFIGGDISSESVNNGDEEATFSIVHVDEPRWCNRSPDVHMPSEPQVFELKE